MAMTRGAGWGLQVVAIPMVAVGFVALLFLVLNAGLAPDGLATLAWPGGAYLAVLLAGLWMLRAGKRAARVKP